MRKKLGVFFYSQEPKLKEMQTICTTLQRNNMIVSGPVRFPKSSDWNRLVPERIRGHLYDFVDILLVDMHIFIHTDRAALYMGIAVGLNIPVLILRRRTSVVPKVFEHFDSVTCDYVVDTLKEIGPKSTPMALLPAEEGEYSNCSDEDFVFKVQKRKRKSGSTQSETQ